MDIDLAATGLYVNSFHQSKSALQHLHEPADPEQRNHKPGEAVEPVAQPVVIGSLGDEPKNDAAEEREKKSDLKMIECDVHGMLFLLTRGDLVSVHYREDIQQTGTNNELGAVIGVMPGGHRRRITRPSSDKVKHAVG